MCVCVCVCVRTGTLVSAFSVFCCGTTTRIGRPVVACLLNIVSGLLQLATFLLIVGWVWSITWGMAFVQLACQYSLSPKYFKVGKSKQTDAIFFMRL